MAKKEDAADKIQNLLKGTKATPEKLAAEPREKHKKGKHGGARANSGGPRANSGGARENSGPDPLPAEDARRSRKAAWREYGDEEVEVILKDRTDTGDVTERRVKMKRLRVVQEMIYKKAIGQATTGDMDAAKEFNNRVLGKAPQPLVGDDDEPPIQVNHDVLPILEKAYGNDDTDED